MTNLNIRKLVAENKVEVVEICRPHSGDIVDVGSDAYKQVASLVVAGYEVYRSKTSGKLHLRVLPLK